MDLLVNYPQRLQLRIQSSTFVFWQDGYMALQTENCILAKSTLTSEITEPDAGLIWWTYM